MIFSIDYSGRIENEELLYNIEDTSFDTEPSSLFTNFNIVINKLNLNAIGEEKRIEQLWGMCGYNEWIRTNYNPPKSKVGTLKLLII